MSDYNAIARQRETPLTVETLTKELRRCGMASGQTVLVHMAMSKLGWVIGGAESVLLALLEVLGPSGTLMLPTHTNANSDPSGWENPPIPEMWWQLVRDHIPGFNPDTTPTRQMGVVPELFRRWPGVLRSVHPVGSMAALGPNAAFLTGDHALEEETGERSPVGRLYELDGYVLLLGVNHGNNTSLHLGEWRADYPSKTYIQAGSAMLVDGKRQWVNYQALDMNADDFGEIGEAFEAEHDIVVERIMQADVHFFKQRTVVDFGVQWMNAHRR